ncbi:MAG: peptide deformylase [Sphaerochaetaceae bacterium]|nr:peptide deformylase [Sphaerochaetaceae bacterium]
MLDIYTIGEEVLRQKCEKVTKFDHSLEILVDAMYDTLAEADGVGLAAPQVGVDQRLFIVSLDDGTQKTFINPEILETSVETGPYNEGCLSVPGVYHDVIRPLEVTVFAQDVQGKSFTLKASGLLARVIQHETDHLNGLLFTDRLSPEDREHVLKIYEKKQDVKKRKRKRG